ncbi:lysophospholipase L1-like esterase [Paenibacillus sp. DS2015]|uniref:SGNH/GDSL hydrolase family protein n=1 Tax=Paenibacillus sp. DS2015 TaxID=3373917 RepID=UPI003D1B49C8
MSLLQPILLFDLSAINFVAGATGVFTVKVLTSSANVLKLSGQRWFIDEDKVTADKTTGTQITDNLDLALTTAIPQNVVVTFTYSKVLTAKTSAIHIFTDFSFAVGALSTSILLYDATFEIGGVKATRVNATAMYKKNAGDSFVAVTELDNALATKQYVKELALETNKLGGKTWSAIGDSIGTNQLTTKIYHEYIKEAYGMLAVNNFSVAGSTVAKYDSADAHQSMALRYTSVVDADIITVFGGTNDAASYGPTYVPIGTMADRTVDTFYGAYHVLLMGLLTKFPTRKIGVFTPIQRTGKYELLLPFVQAIKEVAAFYSIPCLDLFNSGGLPADFPAFKTAYIPDGTHPNAEGHRLLAAKIGSFIASL